MLLNWTLLTKTFAWLYYGKLLVFAVENFKMTCFQDLKNCPECGSLWHDKPIPEKSRHLFGGAEWFSRVIGISSLELDRTIAYRCPDCSTTWDRDTGAMIDSSFLKP